MKPRDLAIVGAVLLLAGFAAIDAVRGRVDDARQDGESSPSRTAGPSTSERPPVDQSGQPGGRLVLTDEFCTLEQVDLPSMQLRATGIEGSCGLWGPWSTSRVAYGIPRPAGDLVRFRVIDLADESVDFGGYLGLRESIRWSADGSRVAWCHSRRQAWELVLGTPPRRLESCPVAYTTNAALVFVRGRGLFVRGRRVALAPGPIASASFGVDGSLALLVGRTMLRYGAVGDPNPIASVMVDREFRGDPVFAFDNCGALLRSPHTGVPPTIQVVSLACARPVAPAMLQGNEVAWSPDSRWIAVSDDQGLAIYPVEGGAAHDRVDERANELLWQG